MTKKITYSCVAVAILLLVACSTEKKNLGSYLQTNELVYSGQSESLPQRVTPYTSMARAAKYNSDAAVKNTAGKMYHEDEDIATIVKQIWTADLNGDKLYNALRALDFVDVYAMSVLSGNQQYIENSLYATSAQNLSMEAIKLHRLDILANSQLREIDRLSGQQNKALVLLKQKDEHNGFLTEQEITYRKGIETALARIDNLKSKLLSDRSEYSKLIGAVNVSNKLEGKHFYDTGDWDKKYTVNLFADAAVNGRREFTLATEQLGAFNTARARRKAYVDYPQVAKVDVNGLLIDGSSYDESLTAKAENVVNGLLEALRNYQSSPTNESLKQKAFDELSAVVLTQVEVGYRLVEKADLAYNANLFELGEVKKQIKELEKRKNIANSDKVDLLNLQVRKLQAEYDDALYLGERAAALRGLYYYAGLAPFDKAGLKRSSAEIETALKKSFNQDFPLMIAEAQKQEKWNDGGNSWAHQDNWLEKLVDEPRKMVKNQETQNNQVRAEVAPEPETDAPKVAEKPKAVVATKVNAEGKSLIQLGAYSDVENAQDDKAGVVGAVKELAQYNIYFEDAVVNGVTYHRMVLRPEPEKLEYLCNKIIAAGYDCMLR